MDPIRFLLSTATAHLLASSMMAKSIVDCSSTDKAISDEHHFENSLLSAFPCSNLS